jgi:hypothetical protein
MDFQTGMLVCKETDRSKGGELINREGGSGQYLEKMWVVG